jgi:hypothetical protein
VAMDPDGRGKLRSALFQHRVCPSINLAFFRFRHPTAFRGLARAGLGIASMSLILDGISAFVWFSKVRRKTYFEFCCRAWP